MASIQERIKERRIGLNMTLLDVAERLGVREATMQRYESGEIKNIKHETVAKLAGIFCCSPSYLMGWQDAVLDQYVNMNDIPPLVEEYLANDKQFFDVLKLKLTNDEIEILRDYISLSKQGKEYMRQTMEMAKSTYKKDHSSSNVDVG